MNRVRLSPTGKFIGTIANPLRNGPGTIGVVFRKHGIPTAGDGLVSIATATPHPINGLGYNDDADPAGRFEVSMAPGYLYDLEVSYDVRTTSVDTTGIWRVWYQLRNSATGIYGNWTLFPGQENNPHVIEGNAAASSHARGAADAVFGLTVTAPVDRVRIGFTGQTGMSVPAELAYARCAEYLAAST